MTKSAAVQAKKFAILCHRWLGVFFCLLFVMWFFSGVVLMYYDYPKVTPEQKKAALEPIRGEQVRRGAAEAWLEVKQDWQPHKVGLEMVDGRPVYRFYGPRRAQVVAYADRTAAPLDTLPVDAALRQAARFAGLPASQGKLLELVDDEDQWTLNKAVRPTRPWYRFAFSDAAATEVYVSRRTGDVVQLSTREARIGAYFGPVIHWFYYAPLRKETPVWRSFIIWLSGAGVLMCLAGIVAGVWLISPSRRYRFPGGASAIPYSGMKRWHLIGGLIFGLFTFTWILSGLFSMNPNSWSPAADVAPAHALAFAGADLDLNALPAVPVSPSAKILETYVFQGRPNWKNPDTGAGLSQQAVAAAAQRLMPGVPLLSQVWLNEYDAYYYDRHQRKPLPVLRVQFGDAHQTWHYISPAEAAIVESSQDLSRIERWLYHGLHSLDFPFLYKHRPAWDATVISLCLGGFLLSLSSVWIAVIRVRKWARRMA
jgi:hypothetical protein